VAQLATNACPLNSLACRALLTASTYASGDTAATGTGTFLLVENTGGTTCTVTIATPGAIEGDLSPLPGRVATAIPVTNGLNIIPLTDVHRDPSTGLATITHSGGTPKAIVVRVP
jgi:hypothetical protein